MRGKVRYFSPPDIFPSELYREERRNSAAAAKKAEGEAGVKKTLVVDRDAVLAMRIEDVVG